MYIEEEKHNHRYIQEVHSIHTPSPFSFPHSLFTPSPHPETMLKKHLKAGRLSESSTSAMWVVVVMSWVGCTRRSGESAAGLSKSLEVAERTSSSWLSTTEATVTTSVVSKATAWVSESRTGSLRSQTSELVELSRSEITGVATGDIGDGVSIVRGAFECVVER